MTTKRQKFYCSSVVGVARVPLDYGGVVVCACLSFSRLHDLVAEYEPLRLASQGMMGRNSSRIALSQGRQRSCAM